MSRKILIPMLVLFIITTACALTGQATPTAAPAVVEAPTQPPAQPTQPPVVEPTKAPVVPTEAPAPTLAPPPTEAPQPNEAPQPTDTETPTGPQPFDEGFDDASLPGWKYLYVAGTEKFNDIYAENSRLNFEINTAETYAYAYNENQSYEDVIVSADIVNKGDAANGIALTCRMSDKGWYELRFSSQSYFWLYRYDQEKKDKKQVPYVELIPQTVIRQINTGEKHNKVALSCIGDEIRVYFNGTEILYQKRQAIVDDTYREGYVGVGAMTFTTTNYSVKVGFEEVKAELP